MILNIVVVIAAILCAPAAGGLLSGAGKKLAVRMQNRHSPPVLQPFYDFFKLLGKEKLTLNRVQTVYAFSCLVFTMAGLLMLILKQDLPALIFMLIFSRISVITGAMGVHSPYSKIGAQREIARMMFYVPVLLLTAAGIYLETGSFMITGIFNHDKPLLYSLPLLFPAFIYTLYIMSGKYPFGFSAFHSGRHEFLKGLTTEFAGVQLAVIELAGWYELVLLLGLEVLFFAKPLWAGILIALGSYFLTPAIVKLNAAITRKWVQKPAWIIGIAAVVTNIAWLYLKV